MVSVIFAVLEVSYSDWALKLPWKFLTLIFAVLLPFLLCDAMQASYVMRCMSLCLSVCLSRWYIPSTRINISSTFFHLRDSNFSVQNVIQYSDGPPSPGPKQVWNSSRSPLSLSSRLPFPSPSLPSLTFPSPHFPYPSLPSPPLPLEVGPPNPARGSGERCKLPQRGLGRSPSRNRFLVHFSPKIRHGKNFNDFPDNQLAKFHVFQSLLDMDRRWW